MKIDQPLGDRERSDAEASSLTRGKRRFIDRSSLPFPFLSFQASSFGQRLFFSVCGRQKSQRDAWLLKRGGVMTRTICSGVSTRLFLFSSTAERELSFSSSASSCPPVPSPSVSLSRRLPALVSPLRPPTTRPAARSARW